MKVASLLLAPTLLVPTAAWAYRPFVSTDAAVADPGEVGIELGYFGFARTEGEDVFTAPSVVLNYGFLRRAEIVGEFQVEEQRAAGPRVLDPGVSLKAMLKDGVLQEKPGVSVTTEIGLLLPSDVQGERGFGFEGTGVVSAAVGPITTHLNAGGGVTRADAEPFGSWGVIGELPVLRSVRAVGEVNGEAVRGESPSTSGLLGVIWRPSSANLWLDAGVRRRVAGPVPAWQVTVGLTFGFTVGRPFPSR